jgi:trimethylamine:corrinoid methyltransferase-like protein
VTTDSIAAALIRQIGPQGESYLTQEHTLARLHGGEYFIPGLAVRGPFAAWLAAGGRNTYRLAQARAAELAVRPVPRLTGDRLAAVDACLARLLSVRA